MLSPHTKTVIEFIVLGIAALIMSGFAADNFIGGNYPLAVLFGIGAAVDLDRVEEHWKAL